MAVVPCVRRQDRDLYATSVSADASPGDSGQIIASIFEKSQQGRCALGEANEQLEYVSFPIDRFTCERKDVVFWISSILPVEKFVNLCNRCYCSLVLSRIVRCPRSFSILVYADHRFFEFLEFCISRSYDLRKASLLFH